MYNGNYVGLDISFMKNFGIAELLFLSFIALIASFAILISGIILIQCRYAWYGGQCSVSILNMPCIPCTTVGIP